jgi:hypothetical protein
MKNIKNKLFDITDKSKYTIDEIYSNIKNCLDGYNMNIYSCGPSFNEFHDKLPINNKTIKVCIKRTIDIIQDADIFIFDNRIKAGESNKSNNNINDIFKIYMGDYYFDNFNNYIKNLSPIYNYPINESKFEPNLIFTPELTSAILINPEEIKLFSYNKNNIIYGKYNIYISLIYKLLELFTYMGIKNFNITGCDQINKDFGQSHYFSKRNIINKTIGYDTFINLYYECILDYSKFNIILYSDESNVNILIPRYKNLDMNYHVLNKFLSIDIENLVKIIKNINNDKILYLKMSEYIIMNNINIILPGKKIIFNNLNNIIKILNYLNFEICFNNILSFQTNINLDEFYDKIPNNFDVNEYKEINGDLQKLSNFEAINHYINHGIKEGRKYKK